MPTGKNEFSNDHFATCMIIIASSSLHNFKIDVGSMSNSEAFDGKSGDGEPALELLMAAHSAWWLLALFAFQSRQCLASTIHWFPKGASTCQLKKLSGRQPEHLYGVPGSSCNLHQGGIRQWTDFHNRHGLRVNSYASFWILDVQDSFISLLVLLCAARRIDRLCDVAIDSMDLI